MSRIDAQPTKHLCYDPNENKYWDPLGVFTEQERVFDICHGCRLCFNLCPSFPTLFEAIDENDGDVRKVSAQKKKEVVDLCYGCKLCHLKCPYTPEEGHSFQLDFPRLILRSRAVHNKLSGGPALRERLLGNPTLLGRVARIWPAFANWGTRNRLGRLLMEKALGISAKKKLPTFASQTFEEQIAQNGLPKADGEPTAKVALFHTCTVNINNPAVGHATVHNLAKSGCEIVSPKQGCCGMPALDCGDIELAKKQALANINTLLPLVRDGYKVAGINPTCTLMLKKEYPVLLGTEEAELVAKATVDPHELLFKLKRQGKFNQDFRSTPKTIAYHTPCHLKALGIGFRSRDLMQLIPGTEVTMTEACTAHDGTWAMKKEYFDLSMKWGEKAFKGLSATQANIMATDCPLAAIQIEQATGTRPLHPAEVLEKAYSPDGFPQAIPPNQEKTP